MSHNEPVLARLKPLVIPIYLPTLVYAAGGSIVVAVQVLLALKLGLNEAGVATLITVLGALAILSSLVAGFIVQRFGEKRAVAGVSISAVAILSIACGFIYWSNEYALWIFLGALVFFDVVDAVWAIARQGMVSDLAPADLRGRATNLYGACQRIGRVFGPLFAAPFLLVFSPEWLLPLAGVIILLASGILVWLSPLANKVEVQDVKATGQTLDDEIAPPSVWKPFMFLGVGIMVLAMLRTSQGTLVQLWGKTGIDLTDSTLVLVLGLASAMELVLFWPAGIVVDKWGRMPVIVTALVSMGLSMMVLPLNATLAWYAVFSMAIGLGNGVGSGIIKTMGMDIAPQMGRSTFFGRWQAIASVGALLAPALSAVVMTHGSISLALMVIGGIGVLGAFWMAWWTPRFIPRTRRSG